MALKRPEIYNKRIYKKMPLFIEDLSGRKQNYVSIMFPESIMMRTKKRKIRFCTKLTTNHVKKQNIIRRTPIGQTK